MLFGKCHDRKLDMVSLSILYRTKNQAMNIHEIKIVVLSSLKNNLLKVVQPF